MSNSSEFSIDRIADLAKIEISASQREQSRKELQQILQFVNQLDDLVTDGVEPFFGIEDDCAPLRSDTIAASTPREEMLSNAPAHDGEHFIVPPVFD